jgi:hypothetical protein
MPGREEASAVALVKQPLYYADPLMSAEQRLGHAYDEAAASLRAVFPAGTVLNTSQYENASELTGNHIDRYAGTLIQSLSSGQDVPEQAAFTYDSEQARSIYFGKFAQASANLGAYLTGYAREQVAIGRLSQADFDAGVEVRIRQFSEIIHLGRTAMLGPVVNAEGHAKSVGAGPGSRITIATPGAMTTGPSLGAVGLGGPVLFYVGIIAILAAAGLVSWYAYVQASLKNREQMLEACKLAISTNHKDAEIICRNMADAVTKLSENPPSIIDQFISKSTQRWIIGLGAAGLGIYLVIQFAPQIVTSLSKAGEAYGEHKARSLKRLRERHRELAETPKYEEAEFEGAL